MLKLILVKWSHACQRVPLCFLFRSPNMKININNLFKPKLFSVYYCVMCVGNKHVHVSLYNGARILYVLMTPPPTAYD